MLTIKYQNLFKKDFKLIKKRGHDISKLQNIIDLLASRQPLPQANKDHSLIGNYAGCRECHITSASYRITQRLVLKFLYFINNQINKSHKSESLLLWLLSIAPSCDISYHITYKVKRG